MRRRRRLGVRCRGGQLKKTKGTCRREDVRKVRTKEKYKTRGLGKRGS